MIFDLEYKQEILEEEIEDNILEQQTKHQNLQLEIQKLDAALNMTVSHWEDMKSGHKEFANKTLEMLASIIDMANPPNEQDKNDNNDNIDGLDVIDDTEESTTANPSSSTEYPRYYNCSSVRKFAPSEVKCTASSEFSPRYSCAKAFDGVLAIGKQKSAWASKGEGIGAWIEARFENLKSIHQLKLLQRHYPGEANKKIEIQFKDSKHYATLPAKGDKHWNIIKLPNSVVTDVIKISVKEVYGTVNNGFKEIQILGCDFQS